MTATTRAVVADDGVAPILVCQKLAPPHDAAWPIGDAWRGYCFYQLALVRALLHPDGTPTGEVGRQLVYMRLWMPGTTWYGAMETGADQRPEVSLRGVELTVASAEQARLLDLLRTCIDATTRHEQTLCADIEADYQAHYALGRAARSQRMVGQRLGLSERHVRRVWNKQRGDWPPEPPS